MSKTIIFVFTIVVIILLASLGYFIFQNQKILTQLSQKSPGQNTQPSQTPSASASPTPNPSPTMTLQELKENIEAAVNSKNFQVISTYATTPKVNFTLMSSECCQPQTPDEAAQQMEYIKDGVPMDFNQENPTIKNLKSKNSQLANTFIGISKTKEHSAAFTIGPDNKISAIQLSVSWKLYNN